MDTMIRAMTKSDIPIIMEMENQLFSVPWSRDMFLQEIHAQYAYVLIRMDDNRMLGYICGWLMLDEFNITNLAVQPDFQKMGFGEMLVKFIIGKLLRQKCFRFLLEVRESNLPAISLYTRLGFEIIGKRINYYNQPQEDALVMRLDLRI